MALIHVAQLKVRDPKTLGELLGFTLKCVCRVRVSCSGTAINRKGQTDKRIAKQPASDMGKRQHSLDLPVLLGIQKMSVVPKHFPHDFLPARTVKKSRLGTLHDKPVPM